MEVLSYNKLLILCVILIATLNTLARGQGTRVGFYRTTCPRMEAIVQSVVQSAVKSNPTIAPGILQMFFHDCFVHGCDASILLDGPSAEKTAGPNTRLRGFEVIDSAKSQLEIACPGVVSCADILALAARDSVVQSGGIHWEMPTGRRDGLVSRNSDATNLPGFSDSINVQLKKFAEKGLNIQDLVVLVGGGHTIGTASCSLFRYRLYNFNHSFESDPAIDRAFLPHLRSLCPEASNDSRRVSLDTGSVYIFDDSYYANLRRGRGVLESDSNLWSDPRTKILVQRFLQDKKPQGFIFNLMLGRSMVKLGNVEVKTGNHGEIRSVCNTIN